MAIRPPRPPLVDQAAWRIFQHALYATLHLQTVINVFYSRVSLTNYNSIAVSAFQEGFWDTIKAPLVAASSNEITWNKIITRVPGHPEAIPVEFPITAGNVGTVVSDALPTIDAVIITHFSLWGGKRGRGRRYFAGVPKDKVTLSKLTAAGSTLYDALAAVLKVDWGASGFVAEQLPFLYSRNLEGEAGVAGVLVSNTATVPTIATQRRRKLGRGI